MRTEPQANIVAEDFRPAIVVSRYHAEVTSRLVDGALAALVAMGGRAAAVRIVDAPGTFEIPVIALHLARMDAVHAVVTLGCVIRGETPHDRAIVRATAEGLQHVALQAGKPVAFGILTVLTMAQAEARSGGTHGNKGREAMRAAAAAWNTLRALRGTT